MKKVHAHFKGTPGTLIMLGDSITSSHQFWSPLKEPGKNMSAQMQKDYTLVRAYMKADCWTWKGAKYGNEGGKDSKWLLENTDKWLKEFNPEVALLQIGSNDMDLHGSTVDNFNNWEQNVRETVKKCLDNGTIVILGTIPPRVSRRCDIYNERVIRIAAEFQLPVSPFAEEIIQRRPDDWRGSLPQFKGYDKWEVPTLISGDGEHPSCPKAFANDYSDETLKTHGDNLHTYVALRAYADVLRQVCGVAQPAGK